MCKVWKERKATESRRGSKRKRRKKKRTTLDAGEPLPFLRAHESKRTSRTDPEVRHQRKSPIQTLKARSRGGEKD